MPKETTQFKKGMTPHNKGTHFTNSGSFKKGHKMLGISIGEIMKGKTPFRKGKKSVNTSGAKNGNWKGGVSKINRSERENFMGTLEYKLWRDACMARDGYTCQISGKWGRNLVVHHINNWADFPELRTSTENGITLSKEIHLAFHKKYGKKNNTREQLVEFSDTYDGFVVGANC